MRKRGKTCMYESRLVVVLLLIGWPSGGRFLSQSLSVILKYKTNWKQCELLSTLKWKPLHGQRCYLGAFWYRNFPINSTVLFLLMKKTEWKDVLPFSVLVHVHNSSSTSVVSCRSAQTLTLKLTISCSLCFVAEDKLYVVMELIEGAPLGEHFNSLKEKGTRFSEERIWHIFIQVC